MTFWEIFTGRPMLLTLAGIFVVGLLFGHFVIGRMMRRR